MGCAQPPPTLSVGQTTPLSQQTSYWSLYCSSKWYLMSRQTGQKLLITQRLLQSFRYQPVGRGLTFSLLYKYDYKSTANPFEQDSCKLGSVMLEEEVRYFFNRKIWSSRSSISPEFIDCSVRIYNGKTIVRCKITEGKVCYKFGEFAFTHKGRPLRTNIGPGRKKGKK
uniref:Ribosomal protein S19 n=1 Tax=Solanum lycopersicum TaxID=4081 RepID=K4C0S3_SOLLC